MKKTTSSMIFLTALCIALASCGSAQNTQAPAASADNTGISDTAGTTTAAQETTPAGKGETATSAIAAVISANSPAAADMSEMFTTRDYEIGCPDDSTEVALSDSGVTVTGSGASANGSTVTITEAGSYKFTGTLANGQIIVDTDDAKVQIVLDGASVTCTGSAALYVKNADKVFVTTTEAGGTLASAGEFTQTDDSKVDGAVFAKSDITFNGAGTLTVTSEAGHGIVGKDDVKFTSGTYAITSAKKGIDCNESVRIANGNITINSGSDGIHADNTDEPEKAYLYVAGGTIKITAASDAIDVTGEVITDGGAFDLTSNGGSANAPTHSGSSGMRWDWDSQSSDTTSTESAKGIKSDGAITINDGTFTIDSADDALHTSTVFAMTGGSITAASGDDGIHATTNVAISGGVLNITGSYEGIEGEVIEISGGNISVTAKDDGMNATSGDTDTGSYGMMDTDPDALLHISGGLIVVNADGDGLDSNGTLLVSGGETYVSGPTNSGNGALDSGVKATVTGGTLIAAGSAGMAENFGSDSTQCSILCTFDGTVSGGTEVKITDSSGNVLASFTPEKDYQCAVITTPDIKVGESYTVTAGSSTNTIQMTDTIYGAGSGMGSFGGGGMGGGRGGRGTRTEGDTQQMPGGSRPTDGATKRKAESSAATDTPATQTPDSSAPADGDTDTTQAPESSAPAGSDKPQMPEGSAPADGEKPQMPEGSAPADGEMPQPPEGFTPGNGDMPQPPEGFTPGNGDMPQPPEGFTPGNGDMPQPPEGFTPGNGDMPQPPGGFAPGNGEMPQGGNAPTTPTDTTQT